MEAGGVPRLVGAADLAATFGDDEAEVHPQPAVGRPGVRPHVSAGLHHRELNLHGDRKSESASDGETLREITFMAHLHSCSFRINLDSLK